MPDRGSGDRRDHGQTAPGEGSAVDRNGRRRILLRLGQIRLGMEGTAVSWAIRREYQMAGQTDSLRALQQMDLRKGHLQGTSVGPWYGRRADLKEERQRQGQKDREALLREAPAKGQRDTTQEHRRVRLGLRFIRRYSNES